MSTYTDLIALAEQIRTAQAESSNTAELVGATIKAVVEYIAQAVADIDAQAAVAEIQAALQGALTDIGQEADDAVEQLQQIVASADITYEEICD